MSIRLSRQHASKPAVLLAAAVAALTALTACSSGDTTETSTSTDATASTSAEAAATTDAADAAWAELAEKDTIKLGVASVKPSSYLTEDGEIAGAEAEVTLEILERLGIDSDKIEATALDFSAMIPALQASQYDLLSSSLFIKESRCEQVAFSDPIFVGTYSIVTLEDYAGDSRPMSLEDAAEQGLKVGVQAGGVQESEALRRGVSEDNLVRLPNLRGVIDALKAGTVDAAYEVGVQVAAALTEDETSQINIGAADEEAPFMGSGVAFRLEDTDLRDGFNEALAVAKEDGSFDEIMAKYDIDPEPAKQVTTEELCQNPG